MRSIKSILTTTLILLVTATIGFVSFFNITTSIHAVEQESREHLESLAVESRLRIESEMKAVEHRMDDLKTFFEIEIDEVLIQEDSNGDYIEDVITQSRDYMDHTVEAIDNNLLTYIVFTHKATSEIHSLILSENVTGEIEDLGDLATYEELLIESENMVWYNGPLNALDGVWTGPYKDPYVNKH